jgi:hypothetical protein
MVATSPGPQARPVDLPPTPCSTSQQASSSGNLTRNSWRVLAAGRSIPWVAEPLGHAKPALTPRVYVHAPPVDEQDPAFADFGGPGRP